MADRLTSFYVKYNIEDTTASSDATFSTTDGQQYFTSLPLLKSINENLSLDRFTFEHNFNILDGSRTEMENNSDNCYSFVNTSDTINSIIFVESLAGTVVATSSSEVAHNIAAYEKTLVLSAGKYFISGCPADGGMDSYYLAATVGSTEYDDIGEGIVIELESQTSVTIGCVIAEDYYAQGIVFTPIVSLKEGPYVSTIVPYFNDTLSDMNGEWETPPSVTITFTREHSSLGFVLDFLDDHPLEVEMDFYDLENTFLTKIIWPIVSNRVVITSDVENYAKVIVKFTKTAPGRYIKWTNCRFGVWLLWDETNVRNASLVQQTDRVSKNLAVDTLSFTVVDVTSDLNLGNLEGMHRYFQRGQYMIAYETVINESGMKSTVPLGKYYLKTFSESSNLGKMSLQSYVGFLDDTYFYEGRIYNGDLAGQVLDEIFEIAGTTNYTIDDETYMTPLYGTITPKTCRKAITEILFACHSVINAHDADHIIIKKTSNIRRPDISKNRKFSTTVTKNSYMYGVELKYTSYAQVVEAKEVAKGTYSAGTHTIYFNQPYTNLTISEGTIDKQSTYYITFTLEDEAEVTINGHAYTTVANILKHTRSRIKPGETEVLQSFSTTLCNSETAFDLAVKLVEYYSYDLTIKIKSLADDNIMEDLHIIENPTEEFNDYYGMYTKRSFDLTGGFIDTAELYGTTIQDSSYYFGRAEVADIELYSGEEGII